MMNKRESGIPECFILFMGEGEWIRRKTLNQGGYSRPEDTRAGLYSHQKFLEQIPNMIISITHSDHSLLLRET